MTKEEYNEKIAKLEKAINSPATPAAQKEAMKALKAKLEGAREKLVDTKEDRVYIEFLNKDKGHKRDKKHFDSYSDAVAWGKKEFEKFDPDMIKYEAADKKEEPAAKKEPAKKFKKGDKVVTKDGKTETVLRINSNGNVETEENDYSHNPETLKLASPAPVKKILGTHPDNVKVGSLAKKEPVSPVPSAGKKPAYDCDELINKEKQRKKANAEAADARAKASARPQSVKNRIAIEKVAERVTANVQKRIDKGEVKRPELEKLINETESLLSNLRAALKKL